jgi:hypothetical protein
MVSDAAAEALSACMIFTEGHTSIFGVRIGLGMLLFSGNALFPIVSK